MMTYRVSDVKPSMVHSRLLDVAGMVQLGVDSDFPAYARYLSTAGLGDGSVTTTLTVESEISVTQMLLGSTEKGFVL